MSLRKYILLFSIFGLIQVVFSHGIPKLGEKIVRNHSFSNYKVVNPYKLDLELDIDMQNQMIYGSVTYHLKWNFRDNRNQKKAPKVSQKGMLSAMNDPQDVAIFDTKGLVIEKIEGHNGLVDWKLTRSDKILGTALEVNLPQHDSVIIIHYRTYSKKEFKKVDESFISAIQWLNPEQTFDKKQPFMFSQSQAILARTWLPCMDAPAVKFIYNAKVNFPSNLNAVMSAQRYEGIAEFLKDYPKKTGEFKNFGKHKSRFSDFKTLYFHQSLPITSYLMAIAVGDFNFKKLGKQCGVYAEPGLLEKAAWEFADLPKMIDSASALYGKYAWKEYNVLVLPTSFPFGGMENPVVTFATPTIITGDRSLVSLLAHELAHSWSGNLVTNETWDDFWLNEGFTVYFESRIMEKLYGKDYADMLTVLGLGELRKTLKDLMEFAPSDTRLKLDLKDRNPDDGMTDIAYEKGRFFLLWCEQQMGRKMWDKFLNQYFKKHAFSTSNTEVFIKELLDFYTANYSSGWMVSANFSKSMKQWIYEVGFQEPKVKSTFLLAAEGLAVHLNSLNQQNISFAKEKGLSLNPETKTWTTHHYLHFLRNLDSLSFANMRYLDSVFHFSLTLNSEIAFDWSMLSIKSGYLPAYGFIDQFLNRVGRRKFVYPIYEKLIEVSQLKANAAKNIDNKVSFTLEQLPEFKLALDAYEKANSGYHSVTRTSIDELFQFDEWKK